MKNLKRLIAVIAICILAAQAVSAVAPADKEVTVMAKSDIKQKPLPI